MFKVLSVLVYEYSVYAHAMYAEFRRQLHVNHIFRGTCGRYWLILHLTIVIEECILVLNVFQ